MSKKIVLSPLGGLANRMRSIMSALALAEKCGMTLEVFWIRDKGLNCCFSDLFCVDNLPFQVVELGRMNGFKYNVPRKRNLYLTKFFQNTRFEQCLYEKDVLLLKDSPEQLIDKVRGKHTFIASGISFYPSDDIDPKSLFVPTDELQSMINARSYMFKGRYVVGVHIRRTDNLVSISESPLECFIAKMNEWNKKNRDVCFYLATDDLTVKATISDMFLDKVCTSGSEVSRSTENGMKEAVVEMFTLANTDYFIGSYYSSFSDLILLMNGNGEIIHK